MVRRVCRQLVQIGMGAALIVSSSRIASAQVTPAAGYTPPDDTPSIRVGITLFTDFTYNESPTQKDADGNDVHLSLFNVTRSYINVTGNISHIIAFRVTPDVARQSATVTGSSVTNDSLEFRIKYAFAQFNLDDWVGRGSWARLGIQQTPWLDFQENIYRYRFQGTMFSEREGYLVSSDAGGSFHYNLPSNYGDLHAGVYNGENYNKPEVNNEKSFQFRGTIRPLATGRPLLRGLRGTLYYDADQYVKNGARNRLIGSVTFESDYLNACWEYLDTKDQTSVTKPVVNGSGYSIWFTPRSRMGVEGLIRYDHLVPNSVVDSQEHTRTILGIAYWFPHEGNVSTALMLDYDRTSFPGFEMPRQTKIAVHGQVTF